MHLAGVEDGSFNAFQRDVKSYSYLCLVEMLHDKIENVRLCSIEVDGLDATDKILKMLDGIHVESIILGGITFAGFNIIDPTKVFQETDIPVIIFSRKKPNNFSMLRALKKHFEDWELRWQIIKSLGDVHEFKPLIGEPSIYFEVIGRSVAWAERVLKSSALLCRIPEPVRVAGIIARGVSPPSC